MIIELTISPQHEDGSPSVKSNSERTKILLSANDYKTLCSKIGLFCQLGFKGTVLSPSEDKEKVAPSTKTEDKEEVAPPTKKKIFDWPKRDNIEYDS